MTRSIRISRILVCALVATASLLMGAQCGKKHDVQVVGRLAFRERWGCPSPVDSQNVRWATCHAFKRRFLEVGGRPVTSDSQVSGLRPLSGTVRVTFVGEEGEVCDSRTVQADREGIFVTRVRSCQKPGSPFQIRAEALLSHTVMNASRYGVIRAYWREDEAAPVFGGQVSQLPAYTKPDPADETRELRYAVPALTFSYDGVEEELAGRQYWQVNLGTQVFLGRSDDDPFDYVRQVLSAFATVVELHHRLEDEVSAGDPYDESYYDAMFALDRGSGLDEVFAIRLDATWAYGGRAGISLYHPDAGAFSDAGGSADWSWLLSGTSVLAHEVGHAIHAGFAPSSSGQFDYGFSGCPNSAPCLQRPDGTSYGWGHGANGYQELGVSFNEGLASTIGQYLLNGCENWGGKARPVGGMDPFVASPLDPSLPRDTWGNQWSGDDACDASDGCGFHGVRHQLATLRGIEEGSPEWQARVGQLVDISSTAAAIGHRFVTSNSEGRLAEFGCDLLDGNTDVSHATGQVGGSQYLEDFTFLVGVTLDGRIFNPPYYVRSYGSDPVSEDVQLTFEQFLESMEGVCTDRWATCGVTPTAPGPAYTTRRLSTFTGDKSAHGMLEYIEDRGWATHAETSALLRSNFMEDW